jgi:addiction module HigA family antidote
MTRLCKDNFETTLKTHAVYLRSEAALLEKLQAGYQVAAPTGKMKDVGNHHRNHTGMTREQKAILAATPGRLLKEEFLDAHQLSQSELSRRTGIPRSTINEIIKGKRAITAEVAFTLGTFFGVDPQFWINLQSRYDLRAVQFQQAEAIRARVIPLTA